MNLTNVDIKNLKDKKFRSANSLFLVEGDKFCHDVLENGFEIVHTITTNADLTGYPNISVVSSKMFDSLASTKTPQTVICVCKIKDYGIGSIGNSLVLDNLQDPGNVGTLIRSAMAFGFNDIYLIGGADPYSDKVVRSSAGTILKAHVHRVDYGGFKQSKNLVADNFLVADMQGDNLNTFCLPKGRVSVIIGNEGNGVSDEMFALATSKISIPMMPGVESLNAGVAGSIIMQKLANCGQ